MTTTIKNTNVLVTDFNNAVLQAALLRDELHNHVMPVFEALRVVLPSPNELMERAYRDGKRYTFMYRDHDGYARAIEVPVVILDAPWPVEAAEEWASRKTKLLAEFDAIKARLRDLGVDVE